jgi:hypothetical protein
MAKCFVGDLAFDVTDGAGLARRRAWPVRQAVKRRTLRGGLVATHAPQRAEALARRFSEFGEVRSVRGGARHGRRGAFRR